MRTTATIVLSLLIVATSVNCASIVRGTSQDVMMNSSPGGARIMVNGQDLGRTPTTLTLKRKNQYQIVFKLDGYEDATMAIDKQFKFGATIIGNIFSWGIIGIVVDIANGSAYQLTPEQLQASLSARGTAARIDADNDSIQVYFFEPSQVVTSE